MKTIIILPVYNEKENIRQIIEAIFKVLPLIYILVVDDNSPDGTGDIVKKLQKKFSNLKILTRIEKRGLGEAYINAFKETLKDPDIGNIIMMDADFSHHPSYLPVMLKYAEDFDVVVGSRYIKGGKIEGWELWRRLLSRWGNFYARTITRLPVADCTSGFNLIKSDFLKKIDFSKIDASGYAFIIELKYFLWKSGARFKEIPIIFRNRINGESKISNYIIREGIIAPWKMILKRKYWQCFICGANSAYLWTKKTGYNLYKCRQCGLIFIYPAPDYESIYSADYFTGAQSGFGYVNYENDKSAMVSVFNLYLDKMESYISKRGKLLDIGAATGSFLEEAIRRGWQGVGVEISDYAASKARQKQFDVRTGKLEEMRYKNGSFDAITLLDTLEHLANPGEIIQLIYNLLKPSGIIVINTPNARSFFAKLMGKRWHLFVPPEHIFYFNLGNLIELLEKSGFKICLTTVIAKKFTLQYIFQTLAR